MPVDALLARLPPEVVAHLRRAFEIPETQPGVRAKHLASACAATSFPTGNVYPLPSELADPHRTLARVLADEPAWNGFGTAMPKTAPTRRRWLGVDPPSVLEQPLPGESFPLWLSLQRLLPEGHVGPTEAKPASEFLASLPFELRVGYALADRRAYGLDDVVAVPSEDELAQHPRQLTDIADRVLALLDRSEYFGPSRTFASRVFLALVGTGTALDPRWDPLFPTRLGSSTAQMNLAARALPEPRRSTCLVSALTRDRYGDEATFEILASLPSVAAALVPFVLGQDCWGSLPVPKRIRRLKELGKTLVDVKTALAAATAERPADLALAVTKRASPKVELELTPLQKKQLASAIKAYGQVEAWQRAPSDWFLSILEVSDGGGHLLYEVFDIMSDSGTVFRAGTCEEVAAIIQGGVQCGDRALGEALAVSLHDAHESARAKPIADEQHPVRAAKPKGPLARPKKKR